MIPPVLSGIHHIRIPVSDLGKSLAWYERVLGATRRPELDHHAKTGELSAYILVVPNLPLLELRLAPITAAGMSGFDPLIFAVPGRADLAQWIRHLDAHDVRHSPELRGIVGWTLVFLDPDGLALRVYTQEDHEPDESRADVGSPWLQTSPDARAAAERAAAP